MGDGVTGVGDSSEAGVGYPSEARGGHEVFADELARFAAETDDPTIKALAVGNSADVVVAVSGRAGVGRDSVRRALAGAGVAVCGRGDVQAGHPQAGDVQVYVVAEVVKPEDRAAINVAVQEASVPTLVVLNKADLSGFGADDPIGIARRRCARYQTLTGAPTVPMVAHLACARLDAELLGALRVLAAQADFGTVGSDRSGAQSIAAPTRTRLVSALDLFGIAQAVLAIRTDPNVGANVLQRVLLRHSGVDGVLAALARISACVYYRRIRAATTALETLMATAQPELAERIHEFLVADKTVLARMAAAADVVGGGAADSPGVEAYLACAVHWWRDSRNSADPIRRACGADIARGSLRLWRRERAAERAQ